MSWYVEMKSEVFFTHTLHTTTFPQAAQHETTWGSWIQKQSTQTTGAAFWRISRDVCVKPVWKSKKIQKFEVITPWRTEKTNINICKR